MKQLKRFYPDYLAEVVIAIVVCLEILLVLALLFPPRIGRQIDLTRQFQPRPEWYFLWLFELIGYFPGNSAVIGTVVIPITYVALFMAIPFIDRGERGRRNATIAAVLLLLTFVVFTIISVL